MTDKAKSKLRAEAYHVFKCGMLYPTILAIKSASEKDEADRFRNFEQLFRSLGKIDSKQTNNEQGELVLPPWEPLNASNPHEKGEVSPRRVRNILERMSLAEIAVIQIVVQAGRECYIDDPYSYDEIDTEFFDWWEWLNMDTEKRDGLIMYLSEKGIGKFLELGAFRFRLDERPMDREDYYD